MSGSSSAELRNVAIDLAGGTVGGMALAIVGQPMDLVKSRMQMAGSPFSTVLGTMRHTMKHEGMRGFFKGLSPPLIMTGYTNAVLFTTSGAMQRLVRNVSGGGWGSNGGLSGLQILLSTWLAAPLYVLALTPIEVVKVRLQVAAISAAGGMDVPWRGPIGCALFLVKSEGARGLFRGFTPTLASRFVGLPFYIGGYWAFKQGVMALRGEDGAASFSTTLLAGGLAGMAFWTANYPLDLLKTRFQQPGGTNRFFPTLRALALERGLRGLYRGFSACLLRAFPANAAQFSSNDYVTKRLRML